MVNHANIDHFYRGIPPNKTWLTVKMIAVLNLTNTISANLRKIPEMFFGKCTDLLFPSFLVEHGPSSRRLC